MKQQLENSLYDTKPVKKDLKVYTIGDLESLSATVLYTGHLPPMGPSGCFEINSKKKEIGLFDSYNSTMSQIKEASAKISSGEIKVSNDVPQPQSSIYPNPIGSFSEFKPGSNFNLGPGIGREMSEAEKMIERIRAPGYGDKDNANHINYEYKIPGIKKPLSNIHIPLF